MKVRSLQMERGKSSLEVRIRPGAPLFFIIESVRSGLRFQNPSLSYSLDG